MDGDHLLELKSFIFSTYSTNPHHSPTQVSLASCNQIWSYRRSYDSVICSIKKPRRGLIDLITTNTILLPYLYGLDNTTYLRMLNYQQMA